jgi:hypothetical protein
MHNGRNTNINTRRPQGSIFDRVQELHLPGLGCILLFV